MHHLVPTGPIKAAESTRALALEPGVSRVVTDAVTEHLHARLRPSRVCAAIAAIALQALLAACSNPLPASRFAGDGPTFDPVRFFTGRTRSWGVLENRSGEPTAIVRTEGTGVAEDDGDGVRYRQTLRLDDDAPQVREWRMRRVGPGQFEATANDMVGTAVGAAAGRTFHWSWTLATKPGDPSRNVTMDQWMYQMEDGAVVNRTMIRKLGVILAEVTEQFRQER